MAIPRRSKSIGERLCEKWDLKNVTKIEIVSCAGDIDKVKITYNITSEQVNDIVEAIDKYKLVKEE